jgi:hypothetical protein
VLDGGKLAESKEEAATGGAESIATSRTKKVRQSFVKVVRVPGGGDVHAEVRSSFLRYGHGAHCGFLTAGGGWAPKPPGEGATSSSWLVVHTCG